MNNKQLLIELNKLSLNEKLFIIVKTIIDDLKCSNELQLSIAAGVMENEYRTNEELTLFSKDL